jgi:DHA2 family multidrug resistance protein
MMMIGFFGFALGTWIAMTSSDRRLGLLRTLDPADPARLLDDAVHGADQQHCPGHLAAAARLKNASGLFNLTRNLGGAVGLAVINTMLNNRTDLHITRLHEAVAAGRQIAEENLASMVQRFAEYGDAAQSMALKLLTQRAHKQALIMAFGDVFLGLTVIFGALVVLAIFMSKPPAAKPGAAGGGGH